MTSVNLITHNGDIRKPSRPTYYLYCLCFAIHIVSRDRRTSGFRFALYVFIILGTVRATDSDSSDDVRGHLLLHDQENEVSLDADRIQ
jgi:hypothetical protein